MPAIEEMTTPELLVELDKCAAALVENHHKIREVVATIVDATGRMEHAIDNLDSALTALEQR
jgi:ABC-type transporter Mla subunit MlaD